MAKKSSSLSDNLIVDRMLLVGALLAATSYIVRGWPGAFFEAGAIVIGIVWAYRAIMTSPKREFRLMATLVAVLLWSLLTFYLAAAHGLIHAVRG